MEINATTLQSAYVGFNTAFKSGLTNTAPMYQRIATVINSNTKTQEYGWLKKMPRIREWIGDRFVHALELDGYKIRNKKYELTVEVDADDFEEDNLGIYSPMFQDLGEQAGNFPDELVWPLVKNGFSTPCFDGQNFFDTDHPVMDDFGNEQSVSNSQGGAGTGWYLMDVGKALKPLIYQQRKPMSNIVRMDKPTDTNVFMRDSYIYGLDGKSNAGFGFWQNAFGSKQTLNADSYEDARVNMMSLKSDHGKSLKINPRLLVVPPELEGAALQIVQSQLVNGGESNKWAGTAEVLVVPDLS